MASNCRSEIRSVILRLRRYRDRMQEIAAAAAGSPPAGSAGESSVRRKLATLRTDLDNDAHECAIGRRREVQTDCEHRFLWPALREAAGAFHEPDARPAADSGAKTGLQAAQVRIQHYLGQLEVLYPTL